MYCSPFVFTPFFLSTAPTLAPNEVTVDVDTIKATEAELTWPPVDESPDTVRGFFRGYRIQFAKSSEWPENIREQVRSASLSCLMTPRNSKDIQCHV